ncbi:MAG TPA: APC family permease, partial [Pseudonocardiaceae bacterium]
MVGAGMFAAFAPAAAAAGGGLLLGLTLAAVVAWCNAAGSAALAARYPVSGGTYVYGRERLGEWWGFLAGWGFVVGKTASCAAMALTVAHHVVPGRLAGPVAALVVLAVAAVDHVGVTRTARVARLLLALTLTALAVALVAVYGGGAADTARIDLGGATPRGVLESAGLLFFAFAGYARLATLGEEVRDPERTIPRAIPLALGLVVALYAVVGVGLLAVLGPGRLAASAAPLVDAASAGSLGVLAPAARV